MIHVKHLWARATRPYIRLGLSWFPAKRERQPELYPTGMVQGEQPCLAQGFPAGSQLAASPLGKDRLSLGYKWENILDFQMHLQDANPLERDSGSGIE